MSEKSQWGSKLGFILASAGSAIGLGAVWKFPYMTAANGGGGFLLVFLISTIQSVSHYCWLNLLSAEVLVSQLSKALENWARIASTTLSVGLVPLPSLSFSLSIVLSGVGF